MNRAGLIGILVLIAGAVAMYMASVGNAIPVLQPMGPIAQAEYRAIVVTTLMASIIVIPVFVLLFYFAWKYRDKSPHAERHHHPSWDHDNPTAEFIWWLGPSAIIGVIAIIAWQSSHALDPYVPLAANGDTLRVQVVALDWKWLFIYPDLGIATVNELTIPNDVPVHFDLIADAPMNAFWVPSLGGMIMVMPGMQTQINLAAHSEGVFDGFSGNLSGEGFSSMAFKVRSVSKQEFGKWSLSVSGSKASSLDGAVYAELAKPTANEPVRYYSAVDPELYTSIYSKFMTHQPVAAPVHHTAI